MKRIYISSNILSSVGYDPTNKTLEVEFLCGDVYQYFNVPHTVFAEITKTTIHTISMHDWMCDSYQFKKLRV